MSSRKPARSQGARRAKRARPARPAAPKRGAGRAAPSASRRRPAADAPGSRLPAGRAKPIRVLIADGQAMDRRGMASLLAGQPDLEVVADVGSIAEAIARFRLDAPDVLVLALGLRGPEDEPPVRAIRSALPGARLLAVSERGTANCLVLNPPGSVIGPASRCELATDCMQLAAVQGAQGTVRRSADPEELFAAVRAVGRGQVWYEPGTAEALAAGPMRPGSSPASLGLSDRELDVAEQLAAGRSNKEIADRLTISEPTVKKHIGRVLLKLGVADRLQAALFVARHPLLLRRDPAR